MDLALLSILRPPEPSPGHRSRIRTRSPRRFQIEPVCRSVVSTVRCGLGECASGSVRFGGALLIGADQDYRPRAGPRREAMIIPPVQGAGCNLERIMS